MSGRSGDLHATAQPEGYRPILFLRLLAHKSPVHTYALVLRVTYPQVTHNMWSLSLVEVKM